MPHSRGYATNARSVAELLPEPCNTRVAADDKLRHRVGRTRPRSLFVRGPRSRALPKRWRGARGARLLCLAGGPRRCHSYGDDTQLRDWVVLAAGELADGARDFCVAEASGRPIARCARYRIGRGPLVSLRAADGCITRVIREPVRATPTSPAALLVPSGSGLLLRAGNQRPDRAH